MRSLVVRKCVCNGPHRERKPGFRAKWSNIEEQFILKAMSNRIKSNNYTTLEVSGSQLIYYSRKECTGVKPMVYSLPCRNTVFRKMFKPVSSKLHVSSRYGGSNIIARHCPLIDGEKIVSVTNKSTDSAQNLDIAESARRQLKIPLVTYPCISDGHEGNPSSLKRKPEIFQRRPQRSHTVALIPERFQVLCNANTLHELKKVLAIQGRFLNRIHSFPASIPQRSCGVNESLATLPYVYRLSKPFTIPNNGQPYPTNVLAKSIETPRKPLYSARVPNRISPTAKLPRFQTTQRQSQKCFLNIDIDRHQECQWISINKTSTLSLRQLQNLLDSFSKDNIHKHIQYLRKCHLQTEIVKKRFQLKQILHIADSNDHLHHILPASFCVEELHNLDHDQRNSINRISTDALSGENQEKLGNLLDSLEWLSSSDSFDSTATEYPKIVLTDYSKIGIDNAVQISEVKWKRDFLKESSKCKPNVQKSVELDTKDTMFCKYVLTQDIIANNIFLEVPLLRDLKHSSA